MKTSRSTTRPTPLLLVLLLLAGAALPAAAGSSETLRNLSLNVDADELEALAVEVPVGELHLEGGDEARVRVAVAVRCNRPVKTRCEKAAEELALSSESRRGRLEVAIENWPRNRNNDGLNLEVRIDLPRTLKVDAELGVGEFEAVGLVSDLNLDLGVGEASIRGRQEHVRRVDLEVGVGEALLHLGDREIEGKGFIGRELKWAAGIGNAAVEVECGVGEVDVRLDE